MKRGFTLVELSIVLVIIGLLIGGILVGQSLSESAQNTKIIGRMNEVKSMISLFMNKVRCMPGDCAQTFMPSGQRGDGDNIIETYSEEIFFANHLKIMGMYNTSLNLSGCTWYAKNCFIPGVAKESVYIVRDFVGFGNLRFHHGPHYMANMRVGENWINYGLYDTVNAGAGPTSPRDILTPSQAMAIDAKEDDGNPATGSVRGNAEDNGGTSDNLNCLTGENNSVGVKYDVSKTNVACTVFFYLQYVGNFNQYY